MARTRRWINDSYVATRRKLRLASWLTPPRMFVGSFLLLVIFGTIGFKAIPGLYTGEPLSWLDALFTATSAVCVTGLVVVDTATYFTTLGQAWVLLLIQLGGLGIITFSTLIILALGRRLSLHQEAIHSGTLDVAPHVDVNVLTRDIVRITFLVEGVGALILFGFWLPDFPWYEALWHATFHSVSAFCNAGFSTFSLNMIPYQSGIHVLTVVMGLVIIGGIGFLTLEEIKLRLKVREARQRFRISLHSRMVLVVTAVLILIPWIIFTLFEWENTLKGMPVWEKLANSLFLSVVPRTAGFNSVDYAQTTNSTNFLTIILMFIGGSPGSTAGGIKTTTFALLALLGWSRFRGRVDTSVAGRTIPSDTVQRAIGLATVAFALVTAAIFILTATEESTAAEQGSRFLAYMFEVVSAFDTVGLSMGITAGLSTAGKWVIVAMMFLGRVGALTFAAVFAVTSLRSTARFRYAHEDVIVE